MASMELVEFDDGISDLVDFPRGVGGVGRHLVSSPVAQEIPEDLGSGHFEGPLLLTESPPTRQVSVPPTDIGGTVCMADVHPPPPTMPEFDLGTEAEDNDVPVSGDVDHHMVNLTTIDDITVVRLTTYEGHNIPGSESKQCRRSARLALRPTALKGSMKKVRFRTRTKPKGKVTAKRGGRAKCPNGCLKTFSRAQDARRHANETMQCRGGGERKSYPCMQCSEVFTRSDALRRHRSPRGNNPPACKAMQI